MNDVDSYEEKTLKRIPLEIVLAAFILALVALVIFDPITSLLFFGGGLFASASFIWLKQSLSSFLPYGKKKALKSSIILYAVRLLLIIAMFFIIIFFFQKKGLAFVAGFSTIVIVFFGEAIAGLRRLKQWKN